MFFVWGKKKFYKRSQFLLYERPLPRRRRTSRFCPPTLLSPRGCPTKHARPRLLLFFFVFPSFSSWRAFGCEVFVILFASFLPDIFFERRERTVGRIHISRFP